ncbi:hypothetical protein [Lentibacillus salinarum]|uniref:Uncharacterized protein n=1 Tax=Lentibacillus salinarum TaxID=446820 RepID=A0ABW3ZTL9_9BACI
MESFLQLTRSTEEQLGRKLDGKEAAFLRWVYKRHTEEKHTRVKV